MKHIFIINPAAGQGGAQKFMEEIDTVCEVAGIDYRIHETIEAGEGEIFVRRCCKAQEEDHLTETIRFYACGGDGTLNEVVNGATGYDFAEVACIPAGTGNDFIRNFPEGRFDDLVAQIQGESCLCDLIRYEGICEGQEVSRYCVNMFNIGFDCNVVDLTAKMKEKPLLTGSLAYLVSVAFMLIRKLGADLRVDYEDGSFFSGELLLIAVANGCYCGGGVMGLPKATTDDGAFDVSLIRDVPRRTFVQLFPKYMKGTHLSDPRLDGVIHYTHEKTLTIRPNRDTMKFCVDGEITEAEMIRFSIAPGAFRFVVPVRNTAGLDVHST